MKKSSRFEKSPNVQYQRHHERIQRWNRNWELAHTLDTISAVVVPVPKQIFNSELFIDIASPLSL